MNLIFNELLSVEIISPSLSEKRSEFIFPKICRLINIYFCDNKTFFIYSIMKLISNDLKVFPVSLFKLLPSS